MVRILAAIGLIAALSGCGVEPATPKARSADDVRSAALERIKALENATEPPNAHDVQQLGKSLRTLADRARAQKIGTEEKISALEELAAELAKQITAPVAPSEDWKPSDPNPPAATASVDAAGFKALLPKVREAVEGLK